jgi:hypothetical protein
VTGGANRPHPEKKPKNLKISGIVEFFVCFCFVLTLTCECLSGLSQFFGRLPRLLYLFKVQQPQGRDGHRLTAQMDEETKRICGQERTRKMSRRLTNFAYNKMKKKLFTAVGKFRTKGRK